MHLNVEQGKSPELVKAKRKNWNMLSLYTKVREVCRSFVSGIVCGVWNYCAQRFILATTVLNRFVCCHFINEEMHIVNTCILM